MQLNVSPVTLAALKADGTIRCLADVKYQPSASRHSSTAFALARNLADEFTTALLGQLGHVPATHSKSSSPTDTYQASSSAQAQLYAVQLRRKRMLVCFDVFLDYCTPELRREMDETVARPIHAVAKLGDDNRYQVDRKVPLDSRVAREIAWIQELDKGPRPYFTDDMNPPCYDDGIRVEDDLEELDPCSSPSERTGHQK